MQSIRNGFYWVWWDVKGGTKTWFLTAIHNGHCTFVGQDFKIRGTKLMDDNVPFQKVPKRVIRALGDPNQLTPDDLLVMLKPPEFSPFSHLLHTKERIYATRK